MARKIAVGFDGSQGSRRALQEAVRLAHFEAALVELVSIEELPNYAEMEGDEEQGAATEHFKKLHEEVRHVADEQGVEMSSVIRVGHPAQGLVDYAEQSSPDLLVIGHSGHSSLWGQFLGTTAFKVVRHAPCSVLVVR